MAGNIYEIPIYIKPIESGAVTQPSASGEISGDTTSLLRQYKSAIKKVKEENPAVSLSISGAKKIGLSVINNYGNITGDYVAQQNIQNVISEGTKLVSACSTFEGAAIYVLDKCIQVVDYINERKRNEREALFKQERVYATQHKS